MADKHAVTMEKIVNLCKARGIIFPGSEIYGGMGNTWDYGPVGVEIKNNIKRAWWRKFVQESDNSYGVDAAILMNSRVWEASGHTASFTDHSNAAASRGGLPPCCRIAASQGDRNFSATESCLSDTVSISIPTGNGATHTAAYSGECDTER